MGDIVAGDCGHVPSLRGSWRRALGAKKPGGSGWLEVPQRVLQPRGQCLCPDEQSRDVDAVWPGYGIARDPVSPAPKQGRGSGFVATKRMGQADSKLRQALPEVALAGRSCLPGGLEDLVGVEGTAFVQQPLSFAQALVRRKDTLVGYARSSGVSSCKRPAKSITGPGIARATALVAFPVDTHGVAPSPASSEGTPAASSLTKPPSSRICRPSCWALSAFDPAFSPITT